MDLGDYIKYKKTYTVHLYKKALNMKKIWTSYYYILV